MTSDIAMYASGWNTECRRLAQRALGQNGNGHGPCDAPRSTFSAIDVHPSFGHEFIIHYHNPPCIDRISPAAGSLLGGYPLVIFGNQFTGSTRCWFGSTPASVMSVEYEGRLMVVRVPPGSAPGDVSVHLSPDLIELDDNTEEPHQDYVHFQYEDDTKDKLRDFALKLVGSTLQPPLYDVGLIVRAIAANSPAFDLPGGPPKDLETLLLQIVNRYESPESGDRSIALLGAMRQLRDTGGQSLLHLAAALGFVQLLARLIPHVDHIDVLDNNEFTPLHLARLYRHSQCEALLLASGDKLTRASS